MLPQYISGLILPRQASLGGSDGKEMVMQETQVQSLDRGRSSGEGNGYLPVFLPGEAHGQRRMTGYSAWGRKELDTFERLTLHCQDLNIKNLQIF